MQDARATTTRLNGRDRDPRPARAPAVRSPIERTPVLRLLRLCPPALLLSLLTAGCVTQPGDPADDVGVIDQGLAEIRIDARSLLDAGVTRVTLDAAGQSADLDLNPSTGTYDGSLILPIGPQSIVARAFADTDLVGQSNPTAVTVETGQVTRVVMRVLDLRGSAPPLYGPILDSIVFPATAQATSPVTFAASVVAPAGDPVTYAWSSSCADASFADPAAASTSWTKAAQGACTITMLATSNGLSVSQSFEIVVFAAGAATGAVGASASFITAPSVYLSLPLLGCFVWPGNNASCAGSIASPTTTSYEVSVTSWGGSTAGSLTVSDNCGGAFGASGTGPDWQFGAWLPPVDASLCILTITAVNSDGLSSTLSGAVLVRAGTPPVAQPPQIFGQISPGQNCVLQSGAPPADCGPVPAGITANIFGSVSWADGIPASLTLIDDCNGGLIPPGDVFNFSSPWHLLGVPGQTCTLTVRATNLQGGTSEAVAQFHLL